METAVPESLVRNLPRTYSDYSPLLINVEGMTPPPLHTRPFRFEYAWITHNNFINVVTNAWDNPPSLHEAIKSFTYNAIIWNKNVCGNIFHKKRRLGARIEGIQRALTSKQSYFLENLECDLIQEYNETLR